MSGRIDGGIELDEYNILEEGELESLVSEGRDIQTLRVVDGNGGQKVWIVVSPAGVENGDYKKHPDYAISEYLSPKGESKGFSELHVVDTDINEIDNRIKTAKKNYSIPGTPLYRIIRKKLF